MHRLKMKDIDLFMIKYYSSGQVRKDTKISGICYLNFIVDI